MTFKAIKQTVETYRRMDEGLNGGSLVLHKRFIETLRMLSETIGSMYVAEVITEKTCDKWQRYITISICEMEREYLGIN